MIDLVLFPLHEPILVDELKQDFDRFMVKDYVKSVKGTDFPKYFGKDIFRALYHCFN